MSPTNCIVVTGLSFDFSIYSYACIHIYVYINVYYKNIYAVCINIYRKMYVCCLLCLLLAPIL